MNSRCTLVVLALTLPLMGCGKQDGAPESASQTVSAPEQAALESDRWVGQWNGPEGTYVRISGSDGKYEVVIQNLDGARAFPGTAAGDRIEFDRDGVKESLRATNGQETGMKWLLEKSECLTVRTGEGYCRQ